MLLSACRFKTDIAGNPDLVAHDAKGKLSTVRHEAVNAMLLNEFLKEHRKIEELGSAVAKQEATIILQQKQMQTLIAQLKEQARANSKGERKARGGWCYTENCCEYR